MTHVPGPAAGREERLARRFPGCAAVVYGHTHRPPTERRRAPAHTMLLLEVAAGETRPELLEVGP